MEAPPDEESPYFFSSPAMSEKGDLSIFEGGPRAVGRDPRSPSPFEFSSSPSAAFPPTPDKFASVSSNNAHNTDLPSTNRRSALLHSTPSGGNSSAVPLLSQPTTQAPLPPTASPSSPISSSPSAPKLSRGSSGLQHSYLSRQSCRSKKKERTCNSSTGHLLHRRRQRKPKK
uniref:Uncharacterized protein n=1 Tax=Populus alba TaxID=43335 RepID=A0A4U5QBZ5_POPAL|nr:hypothetical protein D5086_0000113520 [Populus alba]